MQCQQSKPPWATTGTFWRGVHLHLGAKKITNGVYDQNLSLKEKNRLYPFTDNPLSWRSTSTMFSTYQIHSTIPMLGTLCRKKDQNSLLLLCEYLPLIAVKCDKKETYIQNMLSLNESMQNGLMNIGRREHEKVVSQLSEKILLLSQNWRRCI